jgi:hypothetical protein
MKAHYYNLHSLAQNKELRWEKRQPQNARDSKQKTSDEKSGNPKTQGAQNKDIWWKNRQPQTAKGSKQKPSMKK